MKDSFLRVVFTQPGKAQLLPASTAEQFSKNERTVIETEFSLISPGTELACLSGKEWWAPLPFASGYSSVGRVVRKGKGSDGIEIGQRIFTYGAHAGYGVVDVIAVPLPDDVDPALATFARIGNISITALRAADSQLGDFVAVFGLGLVGNVAAQLFSLAGCMVVGIDPSEKRREQARKCGIPYVFAPGDGLKDAIVELTKGRLCQTVVEATGVPAVATTAITLAGKQGEFILLGSPRGEYPADLTAFLNHTHLWDNGCVTIKGAHEWRFPVRHDDHTRHSIERNAGIVLDLIARKKLILAPLHTHTLSPAECQTAYDGLLKEKDRYLGVIFDWSKV